MLFNPKWTIPKPVKKEAKEKARAQTMLFSEPKEALILEENSWFNAESVNTSDAVKLNCINAKKIIAKIKELEKPIRKIEIPMTKKVKAIEKFKVFVLDILSARKGLIKDIPTTNENNPETYPGFRLKTS